MFIYHIQGPVIGISDSFVTSTNITRHRHIGTPGKKYIKFPVLMEFTFYWQRDTQKTNCQAGQMVLSVVRKIKQEGVIESVPGAGYYNINR